MEGRTFLDEDKDGQVVVSGRTIPNDLIEMSLNGGDQKAALLLHLKQKKLRLGRGCTVIFPSQSWHSAPEFFDSTRGGASSYFSLARVFKTFCKFSPFNI